MKIDVLLPEFSKYQVIQHFTQKLYEAFVRAGCQTRLLQGDDCLKVPLQSPPDLTICFNGAPAYSNGEWLADHIQKPHVSWLLDPPFRYWELLQSQWIWIGCEDLFGCEMLRRADFSKHLFLPHAVESDYYGDPQSERPYDIALFATYIDVSKSLSLWRKVYGNLVAKAMDQALQESLEDPSTSFIAILMRHLEKHELADMTRRELFQDFELHLKGMERLELLQLFTDHEVHVFGGSTDSQSWKNAFKKSPNIIVHEELSYPDTLKAITQTKILLNSSLKNKGGLHERIVTGIAGGACVATTDNPYVRQQFGNNLLLFNWKERLDLPSKVQTLLDNPKERIAKVNAAYKVVQAHHTWDSRVSELLQKFS